MAGRVGLYPYWQQTAGAGRGWPQQLVEASRGFSEEWAELVGGLGQQVAMDMVAGRHVSSR